MTTATTTVGGVRGKKREEESYPPLNLLLMRSLYLAAWRAGDSFTGPNRRGSFFDRKYSQKCNSSPELTLRALDNFILFMT